MNRLAFRIANWLAQELDCSRFSHGRLHLWLGDMLERLDVAYYGEEL